MKGFKTQARRHNHIHVFNSQTYKSKELSFAHTGEVSLILTEATGI